MGNFGFNDRFVDWTSLERVSSVSFAILINGPWWKDWGILILMGLTKRTHPYLLTLTYSYGSKRFFFFFFFLNTKYF